MRKAPLLLENFDNAHTGEQGAGRRWAAYSERTLSEVSILSAQEQPGIVRGKASLRLDYDFRLETTQSGSRRSYCHTYANDAANHTALRGELAACPDTLIIPEGEYPTHLGVWLYGDGSTAWINGSVVDANGVDADVPYGEQDWLGWRFITGAIPPGLQLPLYVSYPLRLLSGSKSMHGSVWVGAVMAVYGGIDFDAVPPQVSKIRFENGCLNAMLCDLDDAENNYPASGVDIAKTEVYIDGARHSAAVTHTPSGKGFSLTCAPDFALCDGWHRAEIVAYDLQGNAGRKAAFFRQGQGITWDMPQEAHLGNEINVIVSGMDAAYDTLMLEWVCEGALTAEGDKANTLCTEIAQLGDALTLKLRAGIDLQTSETAQLRCTAAYYEKNGERFAFCLPDLTVTLTAGLNLTLRHFSKGFDARFIVTDGENRSVPGARICCSGEYLDGVTDEKGWLTQAGLTQGELGSGIRAFAVCGDDCSCTKKVNIAQDFGREAPANVVLTLRAPDEIGVTWQSGIAAEEGFVQYAALCADKTSLDAADPIVPAEMFPQYTAMHGQYTELSAFRAVLGGLTPGKRYVYRVGRPGAWSEDYAFKMSSNGPSFTFAVLADTHNYCGNAMASALERCPDLDFFMHAGDYVGSGGAYDNWLTLHEDSRGLLPRNLMLPVVGNHDTMDGDGSHYRMVFASPLNGPPSPRPGMTYACEIGSALFVALGDSEDEMASLQWLQELFMGTDKQWKILFIHSGPYTCYINPEEYEKKMGALAQLLGIDLVLSGHDHVYHRATIRNDVTQEVTEVIRTEQGVTYVQNGSSGGGRSHPTCMEDHRPIWNVVHDSSEAMYTLITVTQEKIYIEGVELADGQDAGTVIDAVDIIK